jgi:hypothetical protein
MKYLKEKNVKKLREHIQLSSKINIYYKYKNVKKIAHALTQIKKRLPIKNWKALFYKFALQNLVH